MTSTLLLYLVAELTFAMACQRGFTPKTHAADDESPFAGWGVGLHDRYQRISLAYANYTERKYSVHYVCRRVLECTWRRV